MVRKLSFMLLAAGIAASAHAAATTPPPRGASIPVQIVSGEAPSGPLDGTGVTLKLAHRPFGTVTLIYEGATLVPGVDYLMSGDRITLAFPLLPGTHLAAFYAYVADRP